MLHEFYQKHKDFDLFKVFYENKEQITPESVRLVLEKHETAW